MNIPYVMKKCSKCGRWLVASGVNFHKQKNGKYGFNNKCKKCKSEYRRQYYEANKEHEAERMKAYGKKYRKDNKEAIAEYGKKYRKTHKEAIAERGKKYRETHKEAKVEYRKQYYQDNKEAEAERNRQYYQDNKEAIAEYNRQYYQNNKEHIAERGKKYKQSPQGQVVEFNRNNRRRAKEQAQGRGITVEQWKECMSFFNWQCAYSGITLSKETRSLDHIIPLNKGGANEIWNVVPMYLPYNSSKNDKDLLEWYTEQEFYSIDRLNKIYEWQEYAFNKWGTIGAEA